MIILREPKIQLAAISKTIPIITKVIPRKMDGPSSVLSILLLMIKDWFFSLLTASNITN